MAERKRRLKANRNMQPSHVETDFRREHTPTKPHPPPAQSPRWIGLYAALATVPRGEDRCIPVAGRSVPPALKLRARRPFAEPPSRAAGICFPTSAFGTFFPTPGVEERGDGRIIAVGKRAGESSWSRFPFRGCGLVVLRYPIMSGLLRPTAAAVRRVALCFGMPNGAKEYLMILWRRCGISGDHHTSGTG